MSSTSPRPSSRSCAPRGGGHTFQVSSVGGRVGTPGLGAYQSAKWAAGGFSTVLAQEVEPVRIKVTVLEPGGMGTDWAGTSMTIPRSAPTTGRQSASPPPCCRTCPAASPATPRPSRWHIPVEVGHLGSADVPGDGPWRQCLDAASSSRCGGRLREGLF
ncbi:SDR family NAD(P)-dependent oxidoreductase [Streptomyces sp. NPDC047461]|uniref:SDR family NAD(P)-dependent oxidoreductase n=1 Tax=Streptomyces sp. NPDC047461 TaxID=3155619 RepID=UPI0033EE8E80